MFAAAFQIFSRLEEIPMGLQVLGALGVPVLQAGLRQFAVPGTERGAAALDEEEGWVSSVEGAVWAGAEGLLEVEAAMLAEQALLEQALVAEAVAGGQIAKAGLAEEECA